VFAGWTGDATGTKKTSNPILMNGPKTATANWTTQYYLTVNSAYGTTGGAGWYDSGTNAYATVTPLTVSGGAGIQYVFTNWSGDATGTTSPSDPILMNGPKTATANWKTQYYLTVNSAHSTTSGEGWYDANTNAYASVTDSIVSGGAGTQYVFAGWTGDASGTKKTSNPILMNAPKTATANWTTQYELTMSATHGTTDPAIGTHWYDAGTVLTISASAPGYAWVGWTGTGTGSYTGTDNPAIDAVTMNGPISEHAVWTDASLYHLTLVTNPLNLTTPVWEGDFIAGDTAPIMTTNPVDSSPYFWFFAGWTTDDMNEIIDPWAESTGVIMDMNKTVTANYQKMIKRNCARTIGFWGNKNGQALLTLDDAKYLVTLPPYATWTGYPRQPLGSTPFDTINLANFKTQVNGYLRNANARNPGYMLAAQLLATLLSEKYFCLDLTDEVWVDNGNMVYQPGENWLVGDIINDAIAAWVSGINQHFYSNLLDAINNNHLWFIVPNTTPKVSTPVQTTIATMSGQPTTNPISAFVTVAPNPFIYRTTVRYAVPISGRVSLKLYDINGREVLTLKDGYVNAGIYTTELSTKYLSKGIYFLRYENMSNRLQTKIVVQ
ncbi:MAG: T9SS type A sorting domain-containing protein, partial [candidate division WOR-3 bacterium]